MKKNLIICFTLLTLFSAVLENYKGFFVSANKIEFADLDDNSGNDSGKSIEKEDLNEKEKYIDAGLSFGTYIITKNKFYIIHAISLPAPYTSLLEMPPEQA
ncbi:MAG: hypothetical protein IPI66_13935 [Chitinophagaceae bacterium]|nr:hypothetical protein [Chitinophagaceae bacterium]MBL0055221.1 hypothetical protein [Chitinophagaceae bacterium]